MPLEQGLRLLFPKLEHFKYISVREHIPLEQGLRRRFLLLLLRLHSVREHIPLEQGLRRSVCFIIYFNTFLVREHIPLEQGLRPYFDASSPDI